MTASGWVVEQSDEFRSWLAEQDEIAQAAIAKGIEKLATRGTNASAPLVKHLKEDVRYLRITDGDRWFRCFYFQNGKLSFCLFVGLQKDQRKLRRRQIRAVMKRYNEHREAGGCT